MTSLANTSVAAHFRPFLVLPFIEAGQKLVRSRSNYFAQDGQRALREVMYL